MIPCRKLASWLLNITLGIATDLRVVQLSISFLFLITIPANPQ